MELLTPQKFEAKAQQYRERGCKVRVKDDTIYCGKFPIAKKDTLPCTRNDTASDFNGVYKAKQRISQKYGVSVNKVIPADKVSDAIYLHRANNREAIVKECALFVNGVPEAVIDYGAKENLPSQIAPLFKISKIDFQGIGVWCAVYIVAAGVAYLFHPLLTAIFALVLFLLILLFVIFQCFIGIILACMGITDFGLFFPDFMDIVNAIAPYRFISSIFSAIIVTIILAVDKSK